MPTNNFVNFKYGKLANLPSTLTEGTLYFTNDEHAIYADLKNAGGTIERMRFGDYVIVANVAALPSGGHAYESALYYAKEENVLCRWDKTGNKWIQLNAAGLTKVQVNGDGNVLSGASVSVDSTTGAKVLSFSTASVATAQGLASLEATVSGHTVALNTLNGTGGGSVAEAVAAAKNELRGTDSDAATDLTLNGLKKAVGANADGISTLKSRATSLESSMNTAEGDISAAKTAITALQGRHASDKTVGQEIAAVTGTPDNGKTLQDEIDAVETRMTAAEEGINTVKNSATSLAVRMATAESTIEGHTTNITSLDDRLDILQGNADIPGSVANQVKSAINAVVNGAGEAFDTLKEVADWLTNDQTGTAAIINRVASLEADNTANQSAISGLNTNVGNGTVDGRISTAKTEVLGQSTDTSSANTVYGAKKAASEALTAAQTAQREVDNLEPRVDALESSMTTAEGNISSLQTTVDTLNGTGDGSVAKAVAAVKSELRGTDSDAATKLTLNGLKKAIAANGTAINANAANISSNATAISNNTSSISAINTTINDHLTWGTF